LGKSPEAFRTISEVAQDLSIPKHVLRFWDGKFAQLRPMKRGGGRRYYRPEDIDLLRGIQQLLYNDGYTIKGVQKILREQGVRFVMDYWQLSKHGKAGVVRDIPDVAADAARSAAQPYNPDREAGEAAALSEQAHGELNTLLGELEECRAILTAARGGGDQD
jgi:DNA-binding transcriptional MerR regulator